MIASRRAAHRRIFLGLGAGLPLLYGLALLWRPELPPSPSVDPTLRQRAGLAIPQAGAVAVGSFRLAVLRDAAGRALVIEPTRDLLVPDPLVYWLAAGSARSPDALPPMGATLIGRLEGRAPRRLQLPQGADPRGAELAIYSLAERRVVASLPLPDAVVEALR